MRFCFVKLFKAYIRTWMNKPRDLFENLSTIFVSTFKDFCRDYSKNSLRSLLQITSEVLLQMLPGFLQISLKNTGNISGDSSMNLYTDSLKKLSKDYFEDHYKAFFANPRNNSFENLYLEFLKVLLCESLQQFFSESLHRLLQEPSQEFLKQFIHSLYLRSL